MPSTRTKNGSASQTSKPGRPSAYQASCSPHGVKYGTPKPVDQKPVCSRRPPPAVVEPSAVSSTGVGEVLEAVADVVAPSPVVSVPPSVAVAVLGPVSSEPWPGPHAAASSKGPKAITEVEEGRYRSAAGSIPSM